MKLVCGTIGPTTSTSLRLPEKCRSADSKYPSSYHCSDNGIVPFPLLAAATFFLMSFTDLSLLTLIVLSKKPISEHIIVSLYHTSMLCCRLAAVIFCTGPTDPADSFTKRVTAISQPFPLQFFILCAIAVCLSTCIPTANSCFLCIREGCHESWGRNPRRIHLYMKQGMFTMQTRFQCEQSYMCPMP
jgi:hypothetical protein